MEHADFVKIAAALQSRWYQFPIPAGALERYVADLRDLAAEHVDAAVEALGAVDGLDRPPTSGQIRRKVAELRLDAPSWDEVRTALVRWREGREDRQSAAERWRCPTERCDGSGFVFVALTAADCVCREQRNRVVRGLDLLHPLVAEFVAEKHVTGGELDRMLAGDTTAESQIRGRWREFTSRAVESLVLAGLQAPAALPRLEAAREESTARLPARDGEPRRIMSAAELVGVGEFARAR